MSSRSEALRAESAAPSQRRASARCSTGRRQRRATRIYGMDWRTSGQEGEARERRRGGERGAGVMDGWWTDSDGTGAYSDLDEAGAWRSADSDRRLDSDGRSDGGAMRGGRGLGRGAVRGEWLIPHPVAYARVAGGGSPAGRGGAYTSMYTSICLYSRRVACREGRHLPAAPRRLRCGGRLPAAATEQSGAESVDMTRI